MSKALASFGENVRKKRKAMGWSQEEFASKIERDARSIVAIETGKRNPTFKTIQKICTALDVKSSELLPF